MESLEACKQLKYFICLRRFNLSHTFVLNCNLEQLCIYCDSVNISDTFMESISANGTLVHIFMEVNLVTGDGVTALIANSPKIMTCHIVARFIIASECEVVNKSHRSKSHRSKHYLSKHKQLKLRDFKIALQERFPNRKLFYCGCYSLARSRHSSYTITLQNTELGTLF